MSDVRHPTHPPAKLQHQAGRDTEEKKEEEEARRDC
jgi:hypothetical protein